MKAGSSLNGRSRRHTTALTVCRPGHPNEPRTGGAHVRAILLLTLVTIPACTRRNAGGAEFRELLEGQVTVSLQQEPLLSNTDSDSLVRLDLGSAKFRIGEVGGAEATEFGMPEQAIISDNGTVVVLDRIKGRLVAISPDGRETIPFGRRGAGPGEIMEATLLVAWPDGHIDLIDNALHRRTELELVSGALQMVGSSPFDRQPRGACAIGTQLIGLDYDPRSQTIFQKLDRDGTATGGFGLPIIPGSGMLNSDLLLDGLLCSASQQAVLFAASTGDLVAYSVDGAFRWRRQVHEFLPAGFKEVGGGTLKSAAPPPANASMYPACFLVLNDSVALVQYQVVRRLTGNGGKPRLERMEMDSRILLLRDGREIGRQVDIPRLLAIRDGLAVVTGEEPEPWIELRPFVLRAIKTPAMRE